MWASIHKDVIQIEVPRLPLPNHFFWPSLRGNIVIPIITCRSCYVRSSSKLLTFYFIPENNDGRGGGGGGGF